MRRQTSLSLLTASVFLLLAIGTSGDAHAQGGCCVLPDNGNGTVDMPPLCPYTGPMQMDEGLPNSTIEIAAELGGFFATAEGPGGDLGGTVATFQAVLQLTMEGTGDLEGFNRMLFLPVSGEFHCAPRSAGDAIQGFALDVFEVSGGLIGDPDFDQIDVSAGTTNGLPSPGHVELNRLGTPGAPFDVGSFFDLGYSISFEGAPGSVLDGFSGATTQVGTFELCPATSGIPEWPEDERDTWGRIKERFTAQP